MGLPDFWRTRGESNHYFNAQVFIEILDNFLIPLIENWFVNDRVIFQVNIMFVTEERELKFFSSGKAYKINDMACEQIRTKSMWKCLEEFFKSSPCVGSIH